MIPARTLKTGLRLLPRQATRFSQARTTVVTPRSLQRSVTSFSNASVARRWYATEPAQGVAVDQAELDAAVEEVKEAEGAPDAKAVVIDAEAVESVADDVEPQTLAEAEAALEATEESAEPLAASEDVAEAAAAKAAETVAVNAGGEAAAEPTSAGTVAVEAPAPTQRPKTLSEQSIHLGNIAWIATESSLREFLEEIAPVESIRLLRDMQMDRLTG